MPQNYKDGVRYYTYATARVHFPEGDITCRACPLLGAERGLKREYCRLTGEYIPDADYLTGHGCPLIFEERKDGLPCQD